MRLPSRDPTDWFSPMLIKEMRQGLKARTFVAVFLVIQLAMVLSMFVAMLPEDPGESRSMSTALFWTIATTLIVFVMPLRGLTALTSEFADRTIELVLLTRLSAWRIVTGKWASLVLQTILVTVALLPYLVLRYFLGGVDVVTESLVLFLMMLASGCLSAIAIFTSSYKSWIFKVVLIGNQLWAVVMALSMLSNEFGTAILDLAQTKMVQILVVTWIAALLTLLVLEFASGRIAPMAENHALRKRGIGLILVGVQIATLLSEAKEAMLIVTGLVATLIFIDALGEDIVETPSVYVPFVKVPVIGRAAGLFLYPGWASALWFSLVVGGVLMTELLLVTNTEGTDALIMVLSFFGSLLFPAALKRTFVKGNAAIYYLVYFLVSLLLGALIGAVHAVVSTDLTRAVVGFVPIFSFAYAAAHEVRGELTLPFIAINGGLLAYSFFALLMKSREEWKKTRIQEAKAIALHVSST